jgi:molybdate transport system substrate-binding protein
VNRLPIVLSALAVVMAGCGGTNSVAGPRSNGGTVTVFAASSLTDAFTAEAKAFERKTATHVRFSFAGSQELVTQVQQGAPADAVATADTATMSTAADSLVDPARPFARNTLVIAVADGNPRHINGLSDLTKVTVVLADPSVPAGKYAAQALTDAHVSIHPKSLELDVRSVLTKVELGEADAGIVYATDARSAATKVSAVPIADSPVAVYPIGALTARGTAFAAYVRSPAGLAILHRFGFLPP